MIDDSDEMVPVRRPHFELRDGRLFFLASSRPHADLDEVDVRLWGLVDGIASVAELGATVTDAARRIERLWSLGACELVPRASPSGRRAVLVLEPHMDDAVLSVGGLMWSLRQECIFTVLTVAGRSNFTSYYHSGRDYFDAERVSALRRAESTLAMRLLGGRHLALDLPEAPLRLRPPERWSLEWYTEHRKLVDAFIMHASPDSEVEAWSREIEKVLREAEFAELWLPLGVGAHTDHELTREAYLRALLRAREPLRNVTVHLYQDVPYATQIPDHTDRIVTTLRQSGWSLEDRKEDVGHAWNAKLRLISIFGSQFKPSHMVPHVETAAARASPSGAGRYELLWQVGERPKRPSAFRMYSGHARVQEMVPAVAKWFRRHVHAERIRLTTADPIPRWSDAFDALTEALPQAVIEVHVGPVSVPNDERVVHQRVDVHLVRGGRNAWLFRLARLSLARPRPTIVLTGEGLRRHAGLARAVLFPSDPLVAPNMNDLIVALRVVRGEWGGGS